MDYYPEVYFPDPVLNAITIKSFPRPTPPRCPTSLQKKESNNKIGQIIYWVFFTLFFFPFGLIIGVILHKFLSVQNDNRQREKWLRHTSELDSYNRALEQYQISMAMSDSDFFNHERKAKLKKILSNCPGAMSSEDYLKGATQSFFKKYLVENFGDYIFEDMTIFDTSDFDDYLLEINYLHEDKRYFIPDFTYKNIQYSIYIAIEIDEPYTLNNKTPIHYDDGFRNGFFIDQYWTVVRFAEEQIVLYPEYCISFISHVIKCLQGNFSEEEFNSKRNIVPKIPKWDEETVTGLIETNHRNTYLSKINRI